MNKLLRLTHTLKHKHTDTVRAKSRDSFEVVFPFLWASAIWWLFLVIKQMILGVHKNRATTKNRRPKSKFVCAAKSSSSFQRLGS